jgi:hypothetical protein
MVNKVAVEQIFLRALSFSSVSITPFLQEGQSGRAKERSKNISVSEIRKHWTERYFRSVRALAIVRHAVTDVEGLLFPRL